MLSHKYRRIYFHHLKKCGGSTLNSWLDTLTSDNRLENPSWVIPQPEGEPSNDSYTVNLARAQARARSLFHWTDVLHTHQAIGRFAPPNTLKMTMLRSPVERLMSQVYDLRRLAPDDVSDEPGDIAACVHDSRRLPLQRFLKRHAYRGARHLLHNYMTRELALNRLGPLVFEIDNAKKLLDIALQSLEADYDFVGLTGEFEASSNALCAMAGLAPAQRLQPVNVTRQPGQSEPESEGLSELLEDLTWADEIIYQHARRLFDQRHRRDGETYTSAEFEARFASGLLGELRGSHHAGLTRYSVRDPIVGSGFHGRDGARQADCAVWTGPEPTTTLYLPAPPNSGLSLYVWIRGFAAPEQREQVCVKVDGAPLPHRFETAEGYADLLVVDARSVRDFVRLDLTLDATYCSGEPGTEWHDPRKRGLAFDSYGWRAT